MISKNVLHYIKYVQFVKVIIIGKFDHDFLKGPQNYWKCIRTIIFIMVVNLGVFNLQWSIRFFISIVGFSVVCHHALHNNLHLSYHHSFETCCHVPPPKHLASMQSPLVAPQHYHLGIYNYKIIITTNLATTWFKR